MGTRLWFLVIVAFLAILLLSSIGWEDDGLERDRSMTVRAVLSAILSSVMVGCVLALGAYLILYAWEFF